MPPVNENKWKYLIEITESDGSGSKTTHTMRMDREYYEKLCEGKVLPEEMVKKTVEIFINNKSKESLKQDFDIGEIKEMIPEFESLVMKNL